MENENKKELLKIFNRNKIMRNITIVMLLISIFCFALGAIVKSRELPEAINLEEVEALDTYSECNIYAITDYFATYSIDSSVTDEYYVALGDNKLYILDLSKEQYNDIITKMDNEENTETIVVTGMTQNVEEDLKELAIDVYNELYEDELNKLSFNLKFVPYVLNAKKTPNDGYQVWNEIGVFTLILTIVFAISCIALRLKTKKNIKKIGEKYDLAQISIELASPNKVEYKKTKTIFLENYLVNYSDVLGLVKYTDIAWIYPRENRVNGIKSTNQIVIVTKEGETSPIAECSAIGKKNVEEFNNTYNELLSRRPNALIGYTKENIAAMSKKNREETIVELDAKDNTL